MTTPAFIASAVAIGGSSTVQVVIPASGPGGTVVAGMRAILALSSTPGTPTAAPSGFTAVADTSASPTDGAGRVYTWETEISSTTAVEPGDTVTVNLSGTSRTVLGIFIVEDSTVAAAVVSPASGQTSGSTPPYTVDAQTATAPDTCRALWVFGANANTGGEQNSWTPPGGTTERVDGTTAHGSNRNATLLLADEVVSAGATGTRTATASVRIQRAAITILLNVDVDRPIADLTASATTVFAGATGATVNFTVTPTNGAGAPFTQVTSHVSGPATPTINNATTTTPSVTFTVPGTYVLQAVVTDVADVDSLPDPITITVVGAQDTAFPIADVEVTGWTGYGGGTFPTLAARLADTNDATGIQATDPTDLPYEFDLAPLTPPVGSEPYTFTVRAWFDNGSSATLVTRVMEGVTVIAEFTDNWTEGGGIVQEFDHALSSAQVASIVDFDALSTEGDLTVVA